MNRNGFGALTAMAAMALGTACGSEADQPRIVTATGDIDVAVADYRSLLGGRDNGGISGAQPSGYRELNWDSIPDELAAPYDYPSDFFNGPEEPRARGAVLTTPGTALQVSADSDNPSGAAMRFGHINPSYTELFQTYSDERLFSPVGSNVVDLRFYVPGTSEPAVVTGFGAVYVDVDHVDNTAFEYFDIDDNSLGQFDTPVSDGGLSFLGVAFDDPIVHRVRIAYGNTSLGPDETGDVDVAVMDNFIYGEPHSAELR